MTDDELYKFFEGATAEHLPPLSSVTDSRLQIFWVLAIGSGGVATKYLTASQISGVLREVYGIAVSRQRVVGILGEERTTIHHAKVEGRWGYRIMAAGVAELSATPSNVVFVNPSQAFSGIRTVQSILSGVKGTVSICDPYVDPKSLDFLADMTAATSIRLLTVKIDKESAFERDCGFFVKQHAIGLEVRTLATKILHDRYIIHDEGMILSGTSLNYFGNKQAFLVALGEDVRDAVSGVYDDCWTQATHFA